MIRRNLLWAVNCLLLLGGCSAASKLQSLYGQKFRYSYRLVSPSSGARSSFEDDRIKIQFRIDDAAIRFRLQNKSATPIQVRWDNVSIGVKNQYHAARNSRTLYLPDYRDNAVPMIPPGGHIIDLAIPADHITFVRGEWKEKDVFPTKDHHSSDRRTLILRNKGNRLSLFLPIIAADQQWPYTFTFEVATVDSMDWNKVRRPVRPAPPMPTVLPSGSQDHIVAAAIAAGLLGVAVIFLTQEKSPPAE